MPRPAARPKAAGLLHSLLAALRGGRRAASPTAEPEKSGAALLEGVSWSQFEQLAAEGITVTVERLARFEPVIFDGRVVELIEAAARKRGSFDRCHAMYSSHAMPAAPSGSMRSPLSNGFIVRRLKPV